jgi:hypothetical protein
VPEFSVQFFDNGVDDMVKIAPVTGGFELTFERKMTVKAGGYYDIKPTKIGGKSIKFVNVVSLDGKGERVTCRVATLDRRRAYASVKWQEGEHEIPLNRFLYAD